MADTILEAKIYSVLLQIGRAGSAVGKSGTLQPQAGAIVVALAEQVGSVAGERASVVSLVRALEAAAAIHDGKRVGHPDYWIAVNTAGMCHQWIGITDDLAGGWLSCSDQDRARERAVTISERLDEIAAAAAEVCESF